MQFLSNKEADHVPGYTAVDFRKGRLVSQSNALPFSEILDAEMVNSAGRGWRHVQGCISTPFVTLWMFLSQVLDLDHSCRAAVARLIVWLAVNHRKPCVGGDRQL